VERDRDLEASLGGVIVVLTRAECLQDGIHGDNSGSDLSLSRQRGTDAR
jgi:hypothetical protein